MAYNDWKENPNGEDFIRGISATGRSDVLEWVRDVLAPRVEGVYEEFSSRYGWGEVAPITFEQSGGEARLGSRQEGRGSTPLQGAPSHKGATGPIPGIVAAAERYAQQVGIPLRRQGEFVQINEAFATRLSNRSCNTSQGHPLTKGVFYQTEPHNHPALTTLHWLYTSHISA